MTTDPFTEAARAEAERRRPDHAYALLGDQVLSEVEELVDMAEWARTHIASQEPTDAEVVAALGAANRTALMGQRFDAPLAFYDEAVVRAMRAGLTAAYAARRDEEKR